MRSWSRMAGIPQSQRISPWTWRDVPDRQPKDWDAEAKAHAARHAAAIRRAREALRARWDEVTPAILERLADAFAEYFPTLRLDIENRRLALSSGMTGAGAVEVTSDHHALLCDRVRQGDIAPGDALEAIATRVHLYRLIRRARRKGVVKGPLPTRPFLSATSDPSPFLPGLGLAVRHAEAFRTALLERSILQRPHDQGPATAWIVAAFSARVPSIGHSRRSARRHPFSAPRVETILSECRPPWTSAHVRWCSAVCRHWRWPNAEGRRPPPRRRRKSISGDGCTRPWSCHSNCQRGRSRARD
jgi:hypothetical protein